MDTVKELKEQIINMKIYNKDCPICFNLLTMPIRSKCGHAYCLDCLYTFRNKNSWNYSCPYCRAPLKKLQLIENEDNKYSDLTKEMVKRKLKLISENTV
ncbi:E3 ubiquitin-protein ligase RNF125-like isoform X2 [Diabrotica virgifera virgifera]|uniref:E3 ubiquitin-protein ligase RNF125-like isoform X2 n=1 Tax=Diabrotica virgifera virgifera TaxID=50390 RepID=A0A6P7FGU1_DIAVI|nr:E3 ubiquitin-protein ligase RNF125-like isoform X2 [Diabrotica virgifera virgifera]